MSQQQWSARACPTFRRELADAYQARAYIKGPEGAPLVATEKVMVWRR